MYLIGLTGNIASGKTTVRRMLEQLGARTIDADALSHTALLRGTQTWRAVVDAFGIEVLRADGQVDRQKLGVVVFANPARLKKLEALVHPAVSTQLALLLRDATEPIVVIEAIKLVEAGLHNFCDALWVITANTPEQKRRLVAERGMSDFDARLRLRAQPPLADKLKLATVVIDNSESIGATRVQVVRAFASIQPDTATDKTPLLSMLLGLEPVTEEIPPAPEVAPSRRQAIQFADEAEPEPNPANEGLAPVGSSAAPPARAPAAARTEEPESMLAATADLSVRAARPTDLGLLANLLSEAEGLDTPLAREEMLKRLGKWGYWIAEAGGEGVAMVAWKVENLVAVVRDLWTRAPGLAPRVFPEMLSGIEQEAQALLCEAVALITNPANDAMVRETIRAIGYAASTIEELHPLWRGVAEAELTATDTLYLKRLRAEMVTKPI